jgi:ribosome-associated heat shock protein Hsp15
MNLDRPFMRVDRWLWFARFFRSRSLAARLCEARRIRVDGAIVAKPNFRIHVGAVLTFPQGDRIRVVRVLGLGTRRGPSGEAAALFEDLDPPERTRMPNDPAPLVTFAVGAPG